MKNYRYGKFRFADYWISWICIALLLAFSVASSVLDLSILSIFPMVYALIWLCVILVPQCERFVIRNDSITIFRGKKAHVIDLPSEITLVVSYADICPPLAVRTAFGNETHILKDKYAISILLKMPVDVVLKTLHGTHIRKYTTSVIQNVFCDYRYIYSFVCNQSLFDKLIANKNCILIIPESLSGEISVDPSIINVHIDTGY